MRARKNVTFTQNGREFLEKTNKKYSWYNGQNERTDWWDNKN